MYTLGALCFTKIYQFRHPHITSHAYKVFFGLGIALFLEVLGIFYESTAFWVIFLLGYAIICMLLTSILYQVRPTICWTIGVRKNCVYVCIKSGKWSMNFTVIPKIYGSINRAYQDRANFPKNFPNNKRMIFIYVVNAFNLVFLIVGAATQPGISSFLLGIFIANLLIYAIYYTVMKIIHKVNATLLL